MDMTTIAKSFTKLENTISKNSPTLLTALGVAGLVSTVVLAIKATTKANEILYRESEFRAEQYSEQTGEDPSSYPDESMFSAEELFMLLWREYVPTAVMGVVTISCIVGSNHINLRRNAALASLYTLTETTLREYQAKVTEQIGEKKQEKILEELVQEKLDKNPVDEKTVILTGKGSYLCFDSFSGQYFRSDVEAIRKAENQFNQKLLREGWLGINEFYDLLGLDSIDLGDEFGWIAERNLLETRHTSKVSKEGEPCLVIEYFVTPHHI